MKRVNLDHISGGAVVPEVVEAMRPWFGEEWGNPASAHEPGLRAREALDRARDQFKSLIRAGAIEEILFTSSGTEAANLAVKGTAYAAGGRGRHVVLGGLEHPAVLGSAAFLETQGFRCTQVPANHEGVVDPERLQAALTDETVLVALQQANHDLGTLQPVAEVGRIAVERGIPLFVDATASGGWLDLDVRALGASLVALSPHRFGGPKGVGVLYRHRRARLASLIHGGLQEQELRAGTQNVPGIVGAGLAAEIAAREMSARAARAAGLQQALWEGIVGRVPCVRLNGPPPGPARLCTNLNFSAEFIDGEAQVLLLDLRGIAAATGSSCAGRSGVPSPALTGIGLDPGLAKGNLILTLGWDNTAEDGGIFLDTYPGVVAKLRDLSPRWADYRQGRIGSAAAPGAGAGSPHARQMGT